MKSIYIDEVLKQRIEQENEIKQLMKDHKLRQMLAELKHPDSTSSNDILSQIRERKPKN
jgi:hypothetical protein